MSIPKILTIASSSIAASQEAGDLLLQWERPGRRLEELAGLLSARNGFYAFEAALHVFPATLNRPEGDGNIGLQGWNAGATWRDWYGNLLNGIVFFAEDTFGGQFGIRGDEIVAFDPEAGDVEPFASTLEDWAGKVLSNYSQATGYSVAHAWQMVHGPLPVGKRLLPKTPFILGGSFAEENLFAVDAAKGMRYRGELWQQLRDLPDGASVRLKPLPLQ